MSVEERHLLNKIRFFEDMLLRSKDYRQQENIGKELTVMRIRLQKLRFNRMRTGGLAKPLSFSSYPPRLFLLNAVPNLE